MKKYIVRALASLIAVSLLPAIQISPAQAVNSPSITSISPTTGLASGGTTVTLNGSNFLPRNPATGALLTVDGIDIPSYTVNSQGSRVSFVTPAHAVGNVPVTICAATLFCTSIQFQYVDVPSITGITDSSGPTNGGNTVTITGANFGGTRQVLFGNTSATFTVVSNTSISAVVPGTVTAGSVVVKVVSTIGTSTINGTYTYQLANPTISSISPATGGVAGGTSITINGTNFVTGVSATIGGAAATVRSFTNRQLTLTTPRGTLGTADVVVTTAAGSVTSAGGFTYVATPTITSISPSFGPVNGGYLVTIVGTNLNGTTSVTIGGNPVSLFSVDSNTQVRVSVPSGTTGDTRLVLTTTAGSANALFTYTGSPSISAVTPAFSNIAGGDTLVVTGNNFVGTTSIQIGGVDVTSLQIVSNTSIRVTTPPSTAGIKVMTLTTGSGTANYKIEYVNKPTIESISPNSANTLGNITVTINGSNLDKVTSVVINGVTAQNLRISSARQLTFTLPPSTFEGAVSLILNTAINSTTGTFTYIKVAPPVITSISPVSTGAAGGSTITINGSYLSSTSRVVFGRTIATNLKINSDNSITVTAPAMAAGTYQVTITTSAGSASTNFTYTTVPTISSISPDKGTTTGGTQVTISGSGFNNITSVKFGNSAATLFSVISESKITAIAPAGIDGSVTVTVTNATGSSSGTFTYVAKPEITALSVSSAPATTSTMVIVTGSGFTDNITIDFGGVAATNFKIDSPTQLTLYTPIRTAGITILKVTSAGGYASIAFEFKSLVAPTPNTIACAAINFGAIQFTKSSSALSTTAQTQLANIVKAVNKNNCGTITIGRFAFTSYKGSSALIKNSNKLAVARTSAVGNLLSNLLFINDSKAVIKYQDLLNAQTVLKLNTKDLNVAYRAVVVKVK